MKTRALKVFPLFFLMLGLAGCSNNPSAGGKPSDNAPASGNPGTGDEVSSGATEKEGNAIVVYFSGSGNTKRVATNISTHLSLASYELTPKQPYTSADLNYTDSNSRVVKEHNDPNRKVELENVTFDGFASCTYVFLGGPVWWQERSWVVNGFLEGNDFSGKTIIPFATSASSSFRRSDAQKKAAENATWMEEKRFSSSASESTVTSWVDSLNLSL